MRADPRYTNEHKAEQAWAAYEKNAEKITSGRSKTRELLEKQARSAERFSVPLPDGESLIASHTNKLLASQNEASRIIRKLDRMDAAGKGPFKPDRTEVLKQEYQRGLETGGVQGGAICRGVLGAADELGVETNSVVDGFRKQRHRESLERAQHAARLTQLIGGKVPEPPFPRPGTRGSSEKPGPGRVLLVPRAVQGASPQPGHSGSKKAKRS